MTRQAGEMMFLAIYDGETFDAGNLPEALLITLFSMLLVFFILFILMLVISAFKYLNPKKRAAENIAWDNLDEEGRVAALVATIDYAAETKKDVRLVSVKKITKEGRKP
jgi:hypothetical protein